MLIGKLLSKPDLKNKRCRVLDPANSPGRCAIVAEDTDERLRVRYKNVETCLFKQNVRSKSYS